MAAVSSWQRSTPIGQPARHPFRPSAVGAASSSLSSPDKVPQDGQVVRWHSSNTGKTYPQALLRIVDLLFGVTKQNLFFESFILEVNYEGINTKKMLNKTTDKPL